MRTVSTIVASVAVGFLLGMLAHRQYANRPATDKSGPEARARAPVEDSPPQHITVRLEPIPVTGDSHEAYLILEEGGEVKQRWRVGSTWMEEWSNVPLNHMTAGDAQAWWVSWPVGSGTGLGVWDGVVVWLFEGRVPVFWSGTWKRTESFLGPDRYEFGYATRLLLDSTPEIPVRLLVRVEVESVETGRVHKVFLCAPRRMPDGTWRFVADSLGREAIDRLLRIKYLVGVHDQLRSFLPAPEDTHAGL